MNKKLLLFGVLLLAGVAWAVSEQVYRTGSKFPTQFEKGVYVGPLSPNPANTTDNKVTRLLAATKIYDFPSLVGAAEATALAVVCADSSALTITGVRFGDGCEVGIDQDYVNGFGTIKARVTAADTVKIQACAVGITDGGSFNMPDASYTVHCRSNKN